MCMRKAHILKGAGDLIASNHQHPSIYALVSHCYTVLHVTPLSLKEVGAALVVLQEPLKPGALPREVPGASVPLYERLVTVTFPALCVKLPFQS